MQRIMQGGSKINRLMIIVAAFAVLCAVAAVCLLRASAGEQSPQIAILRDGETVTTVSVGVIAGETVTADIPDGIDGDSERTCQWQICVSKNVWVDIHGQTDTDLDITYAMIESALTDDDTALLRCVICSGSGDIEMSSDELRVVYDETKDDSNQNDSESEILTADAEADNKDSNDSESDDTQTNDTDDDSDGVATPGDASASDDVSDTNNADKSVRPLRTARRSVAAQTASTSNEPLTLKINYLDAVDGKAIFTSYTAKITRGSEEAFSHTVSSPSYVGYAPYLYMTDLDIAQTDFKEIDSSSLTGGETVKVSYKRETDASGNSTDKVTVEAESNTQTVTVTADDTEVVVNVYYKAIKVPYEVNYYFQNIGDDQYTKDSSLSRKAKAFTGTIVSTDDLNPPETVNLDGFVRLYHYPEAVAADGSTVFQCYYDRKYFLVNFDLDGGYGIDPIYARYGTPFTVTEPTRYGYTFDGWLEGTLQADGSYTYGTTTGTLPSTIPAENKMYKAKWTAKEANYTVVYWLQNPDAPDTYEYWGAGTQTATTGTVITSAALDGYKLEGQTSTYIEKTGIPSDDYDLFTYSNSKCTALNYFEYNETQTVDKIENGTTVAGDDSTIINVYYDRKEYTLMFFYARYYNNRTWQIPGGSTYNISYDSTANENPNSYKDNGSIAIKSNNIVNKLSRLTWCQVYLPDGSTSIDSVVNLADDRKGSLTYNNTTYYYIRLTARYEQDISGLWPASAVGDVKNINTTKGSYAHFSAWTAEYNTGYAYNQSLKGGAANYTVKGTYQKLDTLLLCDYINRESVQKFTQSNWEDKVIMFAAFWENVSSWTDAKWDDAKQWTYYTYLERLDSDTTSNTVTESFDGKSYTFVLKKDASGNPETYVVYDDAGLAGQTATALEGFTCVGRVQPDENAYDAYFYYARNSYELKFRNYGNFTSALTVPYDTTLSDISTSSFTNENGDTTTLADYFENPPYPSTLEEGAYEFAGWYTTPEHIGGTEVKSLADITMPAESVTYYAKWVPVVHTVNFFKNYDAMEQYESQAATLTDTEKEDLLNTMKTQGLYLGSQQVTHGKLIDADSITTPEAYYVNGKQIAFNGWFTMENGSAKAYTPEDMPVNSDMNVYADWSSTVAEPYRIHYTLNEKESEDSWLTALKEQSKGSPTKDTVYAVTVGTDTRSYLYESDGYYQCVADDTTGYAYLGTTRTFSAKAGDPYNQLYTDFNSEYYPTTASHSIVVAAEDDTKIASKNVFTFHYVNVKNVGYTVKYVNKTTGLDLADAIEVTENKSAVVTERFLTIEKYLPDAFYKKLILAVVEDATGTYISSPENVITFYYTENSKSAYYAVHYMLQKQGSAGAITNGFNTDGTGAFYESGSAEQGIGTIGEAITVTPPTFKGFKLYTGTGSADDYVLKTQKTTTLGTKTVYSYNENTYDYSDGVANVEIDAGGVEVYIFYTRQSYNYTVYYLPYGYDLTTLTDISTYDASTTNLPAAKVVTGNEYEATVQETAPAISGYTCITTSPASLEIDALGDLGVNGVTDISSTNHIIFYYKPSEYTVEYVAVPESGGELSRTNITFTGKDISGKTGIDLTKGIGSTPTAAAGWKFVGWYTDKDCTNEVVTTEADAVASVSDTDNAITPVVAQLSPSPGRNIFYAKFKKTLGSLTISRTVTGDESSGSQVFVYEILGTDTANSDIKLEVTIDTKGKTVGDMVSTKVSDLPVGNYTVTQKTSWSWRYSDAEQHVIVVDDDDVQAKTDTQATVTFADKADKTSWLSGESKARSNKAE